MRRTADRWMLGGRRVTTNPVLVTAFVVVAMASHRSFGRDGLATFDFGGREDRTHGLALQPDGGIVAVGQSETNFAVARFDGEIGHR